MKLPYLPFSPLYGFLCGGLLIFLSVFPVFSQSVSHVSGFYPVDSLYFTVDAPPVQGGEIQIALNCFTEDACFMPYTGGFWLYNRSLLPNTWENQQLTRGPYPPDFVIDTLAPRGPLDKVNVVRVRFLDDDNEVISDKAYFIGVTGTGAPFPYTMPVVHLLVDSSDTFGPEGFYGPGSGVYIPGEHVWNYMLDQSALFNLVVPRERVEKKCILQVLDTDNQSMLYQPCGIRVSGNSSRNLPNRSMAVVARHEYSPGQNRFVTDLYGQGFEAYKWIRFRSGGSAQANGMGVNEICKRIIDGTKIGEVDIRPVIVYLNGSYWSLSFAQDKAQEYVVEELFGIDHDEVDLIRPLFMPIDIAGIQAMQQIPMDTSMVVWMDHPDGVDKIGIGLVDEGSKERFEEPANRLFGAIMDSTQVLTFEQIDSLLDVNSWATFLAVFDYGRLGSLSHQVSVATAPGKKMFLILNEGDVFGCTSALGNHWQEEVLYPAAGDSTFTSLVFRRILLRNPGWIKRFVLRYQDLLNTWLSVARTHPITNGLISEILPEYGRYWRSWYPNSGLDSNAYAAGMASVNLFCMQRTNIAWKQLADQWMPDQGFLLEHRNPVSLVLDSVPQGLIGVYINTLRHDTSWTGLYFPVPELTVSMDVSNVPTGTCLRWKEYPDSALTFHIRADSALVLTPVICPVTDASVEEWAVGNISVWPNPAMEEVHVNVPEANLRRISLFSADGKKVLESSLPVFSVGSLATGAYIALIETGAGNFRKKIWILR